MPEMPKVPVYHSQGTPPDTNRLPMADPSIVGGAQILQGAERLQQSLLHLFGVQQHQAQVDQVTRAGEIYGQVKLKLTEKQQELELRYRANPVNPMELSAEFISYAKQIHAETMGLQDIQDKPFLKKYLATHLPNAINGEIAQYMAQQNKEWQLWDRVQSARVLDTLKEVAEQNPAELGQIRAFLDGKVLLHSYDLKEADATFEKIRDDVHEKRAINFARAHAEDWMAALRKGERLSGFDETQFSHGQIARIDEAAKETYLLNRQEADQNRIIAERQLKGIQEKHSALLTAKYLDHADNPAAPPLRERDISALLKSDPPRITDETARALHGLLKADATNAQVRIGEETSFQIFQRIALPWGHPDKITMPEEVLALATEERDGVVTRKLNTGQIRQLWDDIETGKTDNGAGVLAQRKSFLEGQKAKIDKSNPLMGVNDHAGKEEFANFMRFVIAKEKQYRDAKKDPSALYNEAASDYLGQFTHLYEKPLEESIGTMLEDISRPPRPKRVPEKNVEPWKPGETWQQYKERMGIK